MKIIRSEISDGNVYAFLLSEASENSAFLSPRDAIEDAIRRFCEDNGIGRIVYPRILTMDLQQDGSLRFSFEAAQQPKVTLGQYIGLKIDPGFDSDMEALAITAAAENTEVEIPSLIVDRKLDSMILEKKASVLESSSVNAASDIRMILSVLLPGTDENLLWDKAIEAAVRYTETGGMGLHDFVQAIVSVSEAEPERVEELVNDRITQRRSSEPEVLADQAFAAFLRVNGKTEEQWRAENYKSALVLSKIDLMLDEIVAEEAFSVSEDEFTAALSAMSMQYQLPREDILNMIPREALEYQVKLGKARSVITETAIQV